MLVSNYLRIILKWNIIYTNPYEERIVIEVEVKMKVSSLAKIEKFLLEKGFTQKSHVREEDAYFDNEEGRIRKSGQAMRIRTVTDRNTGDSFAQINFKGVRLDATSMTRAEHETSVKDGKVMEQILGQLGFFAVEPKVLKDRVELERNDMVACMDCVEGLGEFLELEVIASRLEEKDVAMRQIEALIDELGDLIVERTNNSYLSQLMGISDEV